MSFEITDRVPRRTFARITGGLYLSFILTSVLADTFGHIGLGDTAQVLAASTRHPDAFRVALVCAFLSTFLFLSAAWGLHVLLRGVNKDLALLFLALNAVGVAVQCASMLGLVSAMLLGDPTAGPGALTQPQLTALAQHDIDVYRTGFVVAQLFFGTWLFPLGYLVLRSGFLPRFLGALLILDGAAELVWFLQALLLPTHPEINRPGTVLSFLAEVGLTVWLLVRGVRDPVADASERRPVPTAAGAGSRQDPP